MAKPIVQRIYVALLDQGPDAWCAVDALPKGGDTYEIVAGPADATQRTEYGAGDVVRCRSTTRLNHERILVATERLSGRGGGEETPGKPTGR